MKFFYCISAATICFLLNLPVFGQENTPQQDNATQESQSDNAKQDAFLKLTKEISSLRNKIDYAFANMPVGFPKEQQKELDKHQLDAPPTGCLRISSTKYGH